MRSRIAAAGEWFAERPIVRRVRDFVDDQVATYEVARLVAKHRAIESFVRRGRQIQIAALERQTRELRARSAEIRANTQRIREETRLLEERNRYVRARRKPSDLN